MERKIEQFKIIFEKNLAHKMTYADFNPYDDPIFKPIRGSIEEDGLTSGQRWIARHPERKTAYNNKWKLDNRRYCEYCKSEYDPTYWNRHIISNKHIRLTQTFDKKCSQC